MDNLYCTGKENTLKECRFDGWAMHDCALSEAAGVVCEHNSTIETSNEVVVPKPQYKFHEGIEVRITGGRSENEGLVEVRFGDEDWGLVCGDGWGLLEANVVCHQLNLGYGHYAIQTSSFGGLHQKILLGGLKCTGREANISSCNIGQAGKVLCPGNIENIAAVMCAKELPDLIPDDGEVMRSAYLEDRQIMFLLCAMEENCLSSEAYKYDRNDYSYYYEQRRLLRFTARIGNIGTVDFKPFAPRETWQWHSCHLHYHSMEVFAHFDILNSRGQKVAEGHKASFCLEDNECRQGIKRKYFCSTLHGDQGISVGCFDTYKSSIDCQWVDITELSPGYYYFKLSINPEFKVAELNYDNNAALCTMYYSSVSVDIFNCTIQRP